MINPPLNGEFLNSGTWENKYTNGEAYYNFNDESSKYYDWDGQGVWADSNGYSGWWFSVSEDITYQGKDFIGSSAIVIDANENGIYDDNDYVIGHSYALEDGNSGTWERDPGAPYGDVNGGAFGLFEVDVKLKYIGSNEKDKVLGGLKKDVFKTKGGKDYIFAGKGNDKIYSGSGKDKVLGGLGNDLIIAGSGNDVITGGLGKDRIKGGAGKDIFKLSKGKGYDLIQDFKNKQDKIFIGSAKKLKLKNKGKDVYIYKGKDLLAKAKGAAGDLSIKGKYLV